MGEKDEYKIVDETKEENHLEDFLAADICGKMEDRKKKAKATHKCMTLMDLLISQVFSIRSSLQMDSDVSINVLEDIEGAVETMGALQKKIEALMLGESE